MTSTCAGFILSAVDRDGARVVWLGPGLGMGTGPAYPFGDEHTARNALVAVAANAPGEYHQLRVEPLR